MAKRLNRDLFNWRNAQIILSLFQFCFKGFWTSQPRREFPSSEWISLEPFSPIEGGGWISNHLQRLQVKKWYFSHLQVPAFLGGRCPESVYIHCLLFIGKRQRQSVKFGKSRCTTQLYCQSLRWSAIRNTITLVGGKGAFLSKPARRRFGDSFFLPKKYIMIFFCGKRPLFWKDTCISQRITESSSSKEIQETKKR